jgi:DNA-binding response OmpR family regulator
MPRPKTILWVDDEVDGLADHRRYLEEQGFAVEQAAHGDDALALLRRQPYSVVLLDEQMPGRRGLELLAEIRAIDPAMPVVMVTQSEDASTLRDAIGVEVDDYLVKPVHPRQILSVVTRLVEGDRIRQQRLARDFVTRFRELEARRGGTLAWREWIELVVELTRWEVKLDAGFEPGLSEELAALQGGLRRDFVDFIRRNYPRWLANPEGDRPPLSVDARSSCHSAGQRRCSSCGLPALTSERARAAAAVRRRVALLQHRAHRHVLATRSSRDLPGDRGALLRWEPPPTS